MLVFTHGSLVFKHGSFTRLFLLKIIRLAVSMCRGWLAVSVYLHLFTLLTFSIQRRCHYMHTHQCPSWSALVTSLLVCTRDILPGLHS